MDEDWKPLLQRNRTYLVKNIDFQESELWDAVQGVGIITGIQVQSLQVKLLKELCALYGYTRSKVKVMHIWAKKINYLFPRHHLCHHQKFLFHFQYLH